MNDILLNIWITVFNPATFEQLLFSAEKSCWTQWNITLIVWNGYMQSLSHASDLHNHNYWNGWNGRETKKLEGTKMNFSSD